MEKVFIALGGNVGRVSEKFEMAIEKIREMIGPVIKESSLYKTEPWGNKNQDDFLNSVICVETNLTSDEVLKNILAIEKAMGRNRNKDNQFAPRTIDIDILFYGNKIINTDHLIIPHPRLHLRNFVLTPLMEIAPGLIHPILNKTIEEISGLNTDSSVVRII
ncbi:2-amino-4-hydroxy-6-hydroxymethyldihydropteridine diphosphokinase [Ginsengibacter hankyongi]|uniref:2-amino-4-hydroxy-6-hydroxymethyldihydropteridine pyrophosphokinase n=1 Tax=Ginsengibacter hankyongi TaxID=2607284 RepID=A0A5J5IAX7_9BACT|nr:2-amino-4-hydroxy-6-hydroxymethyldihydropteridine diphosphokinase [Ginsengibacter hankyongi]KAA9035888.1 2-amino-4-hydroxy-6-hydroxymethyldihydropteridine diphosphokinase [Ginsengibacter hankyongi]